MALIFSIAITKFNNISENSNILTFKGYFALIQLAIIRKKVKIFCYKIKQLLAF